MPLVLLSQQVLCLRCSLLFTPLYCYDAVRYIWIATVDTVVAVDVYHSDKVFSVSYKLHFRIVFVSCAVARRVSPPPVSAQDWDRCQASPFGIYGGQSGTVVISVSFCHATSTAYLSAC